MASQEDDDKDTIRVAGQTNGADPSDDDDEEFHYDGDYSTGMEEILGENGDGHSSDPSHNDDQSDEEFVYDGQDAEKPFGGYRAQLQDALGEEIEEEETSSDTNLAAGDSSFNLNVTDTSSISGRVSQREGTPSDVTMSTPSASPFGSPAPQNAQLNGSLHRPVRPYLNPAISRLRSHASFQASPSRNVSESSLFSTHGHTDMSPSPSHISALSRTSSVSNLRGTPGPCSEYEKESFRWTALKSLGDIAFNARPDKANAVLGSQPYGSPTVMASNGLICIGTDMGRVLIFDFKQHLKGVCGDDNSARTVGPVTALALSHDHTFVAVGHAYGHIQLFDVNNLAHPARSVPPTTRAAVASGRQEGHLFGSRIVALGFVAGRHTAFVSADDQGLAFYHSLGKVLFMDANDVLRVLGKYPERDPLPQPQAGARKAATHGKPQASSSLPTQFRYHPPKGSTILGMAPLPLGPFAHPIDTYQLTALLTPVKLVIVGLKPTPKTWFRRHRDSEEELVGPSRLRGCLAWFPNTIPQADNSTSKNSKSKVKEPARKHTAEGGPFIVFSWGRALFVLRIHESRIMQRARNQKSGKLENVETGKVNFEDRGSVTLDNDILAVQWLNSNQILVLTTHTLALYDVRTKEVIEEDRFPTAALRSPLHSDANILKSDVLVDVSQSIRVYKGKIFSLERQQVRVGTLLTWADRILNFVQEGDFLRAIDTARAYYLGQAPGNRNGLPENEAEMRKVVGEKIRELMVASARYTFSEDRLTDATHITTDNRGVDRTDLFEGLVITCARACVAIQDYDFLFEELFQHYDDNGITMIYLRQLEPFILDNSISFVPPRITQRLIAMHEDAGNLVEAERLIWHIDPGCLDIDHALHLCQRNGLYDALIYIYTRALADYISPIIEMIDLIREIFRRRAQIESSQTPTEEDQQSLETLTTNAYRVYPYLTDVLSGLSYPNSKQTSEAEATRAQNVVYSFLFYGRSSTAGGRLILTVDDGVEPTYPYTRLFLRFDTEAFLHSLDIAFEHHYFNGDNPEVNRQIIIKILLELTSSDDFPLSSADITLVNIFVARNIPKYPQSIHLSPTTQQNILIALASDSDQSTREDRQLAAEYLLSRYNPHNHDGILSLFEQAGFFRIIRRWYRQEGQWTPLIETYLSDPELPVDNMFSDIEGVLQDLTKSRPLPDEVVQTLVDALPRLLDSSVTLSALLVDRFMPEAHTNAVHSIDGRAEFERYAYLRCLLGPPGGEDDPSSRRMSGPSSLVEPLQRLFVSLLCRHDRSHAISTLQFIQQNQINIAPFIQICEDEKVYDAVVWSLNACEEPMQALSKIEGYTQSFIEDVARTLMQPSGVMELQSLLSQIRSLGHLGIEICTARSQSDGAEVPLEDLWFKLLSCHIDSVQTTSAALPPSPPQEAGDLLTDLRQLVQDTFTNLVSASSTKVVSFPRLFKRLVDATARSRAGVDTPYTEFRMILTTMLESYRSEGDILLMTKKILDRDLFDTMEENARERKRGWMIGQGRCVTCKKPCSMPELGNGQTYPSLRLIVSRNGAIYHQDCSPYNSA